jgi:hypothetical protein
MLFSLHLSLSGLSQPLALDEFRVIRVHYTAALLEFKHLALRQLLGCCHLGLLVLQLKVLLHDSLLLEFGVAQLWLRSLTKNLNLVHRWPRGLTI